jgi:predicted dehydrogenase
MKADEDVEFVCICTPSGSHLEPALLMAEGKKNLIIEKPLEVTPERCDRIIEACDKAGVLLSGVFQTRFHPVMRELKEAVDKGLFGTISLCSGYVKWFRDQEYYDASGWRGTWALDGGGAVMNQSIHVADLLLWLMGPVGDIKAFADTLSHHRIEVEDTLTGIFRFERGTLGTIESTTGAWPGSFKKVEICGSRGHVVIEEDRIVCWEFEDGTPAPAAGEDAAGGGVKDPMDIGYAAHMKQIEDCVRAFREGREPAVGGREAKKAVQLVLDLYKAAGLRP